MINYLLYISKLEQMFINLFLNIVNHYKLMNLFYFIFKFVRVNYICILITMSTQYYQKLQDLFHQKQPDIQTVKCKKINSQAQAYNELLENKIKPYLLAYRFVEVLQQNFNSSLTIDNYRLKKIQEAQKGAVGDTFSKNFRQFCQKKTQAMKTQKYINDIEFPKGLSQKGFDQKLNYLVNQNQMLLNWLIVTATQVKSDQLKGQQQKVYKAYIELKKKVQKQNEEFPFNLLDQIQRFKSITCLIKPAVREYQKIDKTISQSNYENKIEKMVKDYINTKNTILLLSNHIRKLIDNIKSKKCPIPSIFTLNTPDIELKELVKELIKQISDLFRQLQLKSQAKQPRIFFNQFTTEIKQGVTYQQLLQFVEEMHQEIYSEDEPSIAKKMTKIKQYTIRQHEQSLENYISDEHLQETKRWKDACQQAQLENERLMSIKKENQQFRQILKQIRTTLNNKSEIMFEQATSIQAYQSLPQQIAQVLSYQVDQKQKITQQNTESVQLQNNSHLIQKYIQQQHQDERFLCQKQNIIKQLQTKLNQVTFNFDKLQIEQRALISKRKTQMQEQKAKVLRLQSVLQQERKCVKNLKETKIQLQIEIQRQKLQINTIIQEMAQMSDKLTEENQRHDIQMQNLKEKYQHFKKSCEDDLIQSKNQAEDQMNRQLQEIRHNHQIQLQSYQRQKKDLLEQLQEYKKKYYQEVALKLLANCFEKKLQEQKVETEKTQLKELQRKYNQKFQFEIQAALKQNQTLQEQIKCIKAEKEQLVSKLQAKAQQIKMANDKLISIQSLLFTTQQEKAKLLEDYSKLMDQSRAIQQTMIRYRHQESFNVLQELSQEQVITKATPLLVSYTKSLFNEEIFEFNQLQKEILIQHLEKYASGKISRTKLLYKYDTRNKTNFHQYIDDIKGLALVIKTKNAIIAGFYPQALKEKQILNKGGLLVSVTNNKSYQLFTKKPGDNSTKNIYRGMIYDNFFVIYGNAEIRIKSGFRTVFSNFGVSNAYFNHDGDKIDKFLNEGDKREVQFQNCQFYQVLFENSRFI